MLVLAVVAGAGIMLGNIWRAKISSRPTATHTYPQEFPKEKLPPQIDGFKRDSKEPSLYQILRPSRENPNIVDVDRSDRIGVTDWGIQEGGVKEYVKDEETDELEPGVYCDRKEPVDRCYAASNSGRIWDTSDLFESLTREQLARWTVHFIAAVKE